MGMIITRRPGEAVRVGDALVKVVRLSNGRVKLSIDAPAEVRIAPVEHESSSRLTAGPAARAGVHVVTDQNMAPREFETRSPASRGP